MTDGHTRSDSNSSAGFTSTANNNLDSNAGNKKFYTKQLSSLFKWLHKSCNSLLTDVLGLPQPDSCCNNFGLFLAYS